MGITYGVQYNSDRVSVFKKTRDPRETLKMEWNEFKQLTKGPYVLFRHQIAKIQNKWAIEHWYLNFYRIQNLSKVKMFHRQIDLQPATVQVVLGVALKWLKMIWVVHSISLCYQFEKSIKISKNLSREFSEFESDLKFWPGPSQLTLENL